MRHVMAALALSTAQAMADPAVIETVTAEQRADDWHFSVTLSHADTGWDDYADGWRIVDPDSGVVYGTRTLLHPHVNEQPFTRSLSGVEIPPDVDVVLIEESTNVTGWAGINPPLPPDAPLAKSWKPRNSRVFAMRPTDLCSPGRWDAAQDRAIRNFETGLLNCEVRANRRIMRAPDLFRRTEDGVRPFFR